jgi:hypothetical protein
MMKNNPLKIIRPLALASALLVSAPFFVMLDNTLYGNNMVVAGTNPTLPIVPTHTTIIFKS